MLFISYLSYRKRHLPVARTMILIMLAGFFYAFGYGLELWSRNLAEQQWALQIEYAGIPFVSPLWLYLVIQFTGTAARYRKILAPALFAIPLLIFLLHFTNDWHHLVYERFVPNSDPIPPYATIKGPGYKLHSVYSYLVMISGFLLFIPMYLKSLPIVRKQIFVLILGAAAPMLFNMFFWFGVTFDLTPFGFAVSGVVYSWGIFRINLFRLTPLALAKVFSTIRDGVVLLDYDNQIVSFNRAAERVFPELLSTSRYPAPASSVLSDFPDLLERLSSSNDAEERYSFRRMLDRRTMHYIASLTPIHDTGNVPIGKMLMFVDVTELKENARMLAELNEFKDKLFTVVAHDIRDPIAMIVSLTDLLGEEVAAAGNEHAELFREMRGQVRGTFNLVDNLLDWYRSQKGRIAFNPQAWNLRQVVAQALSLSSARAGMKDIRLSERIDASLVVNADKEMLDLILRNLLSNAIKYTGTFGEIVIDARAEDSLIVVSVSDNGAGIDEETSNLLRQEELFFKASGSEEESGETRFGLVLTREFVRIHGGRLWFESVSGVGTTFSFTLPAYADDRVSFDEERREEG